MTGVAWTLIIRLAGSFVLFFRFSRRTIFLQPHPATASGGAARCTITIMLGAVDGRPGMGGRGRGSQNGETNYDVSLGRYNSTNCCTTGARKSGLVRCCGLVGEPEPACWVPRGCTWLALCLAGSRDRGSLSPHRRSWSRDRRALAHVRVVVLVPVFLMYIMGSRASRRAKMHDGRSGSERRTMVSSCVLF